MPGTHTYTEQSKDRMAKAIAYTQQALQRIRAGRATPDMLSHLKVDYYGTQSPLDQAASITAPDSRTLMIKPWDKALIPEVEKAIQQSDLGLSPHNDAENVIINIPPLSEERRKQLLKQARNEAEQGRVRIRGLRKEANEAIKQDEDLNEDESRNLNNQIQDLTNHSIQQLDALLASREKEIMQP